MEKPWSVFRSRGAISPRIYLEENDAYHALDLSEDLIITGPTGTNVNDLVLLLVE